MNSASLDMKFLYFFTLWSKQLYDIFQYIFIHDKQNAYGLCLYYTKPDAFDSFSSRTTSPASRQLVFKGLPFVLNKASKIYRHKTAKWFHNMSGGGIVFTPTFDNLIYSAASRAS